MKFLFLGLGNPGTQYDRHRHNVGFWWIDAFAHQHHMTLTQENKFNAQLGKTLIQGHDVFIAKPQTYMNKSGLSAQTLMHYFDIPCDQMLVIHDELDIPVGTARLKQGGGHGGHNGLRSIMEQCQCKDFQRLRLGIDHPGHKSQVANYVLHNPSQTESQQIEQRIDDSLAQVPHLLNGDWQKAMNQLHTLT